MKLNLLHLLLFALIILNTSLLSQSQYFKKLFKNNNTAQIIKPLNSDLISVVDNMVISYEDGNNEKRSYTYNSNGKFSVVIKEQMYDNALYIERLTHAYDINGNLTSLLIADKIGDQWIDSWRESYSYNSNNKLALKLAQRKNGDQWQDVSRVSYSYDSNGNLTLRTEEVQDSPDQWRISLRITYRYDPNGNLIWEFDEYWSGSELEKGHPITYSYDSTGVLISKLFESWDGSQWVNSHQITNTYDAQKKLIMELWKIWNDGQWENFARRAHTYNSSGNISLMLAEILEDSEWKNFERQVYTYNNGGKLTLMLFERWAENQWENVNRETYAYDSNDNLTSALFEIWENNLWTRKDNGLTFNDALGNTFDLYCSEVNIVYKTVTDVLEEIKPISEFSLSQNFPNPFNPTTIIEFSLPSNGFVSLKVFDILGKEVASLLSKNLSLGNYSIEFAGLNLNSGIYFYQLNFNGRSHSKKMILLK